MHDEILISIVVGSCAARYSKGSNVHLFSIFILTHSNVPYHVDETMKHNLIFPLQPNTANLIYKLTVLVYGWAIIVKNVITPCRGDKGNMGEDYCRHIWRLLSDVDRPNGGGNPPLLIMWMATAFIRARSDSANSNKERWQRNFLCWRQNRGVFLLFIYLCMCSFLFLVEYMKTNFTISDWICGERCQH